MADDAEHLKRINDWIRQGSESRSRGSMFARYLEDPALTESMRWLREARGPKQFEALMGFLSGHGFTHEALGIIRAETGTTASPFLSTLHRAADLNGAPDPLRWLVRGVLAEASFGPLAGEQKCLKTHIAGAVMVSVASGVPLFGVDGFTVEAARPVLAYVGEGGKDPFERRLRRLAAAYGLKVSDLPIVWRVGVATGGSFIDQLVEDLAKEEPGLASIDPLYAFHGTDVRASQLHERGALLSAWTAPCVEAGAFLLVNDHFNSTGTGFGLQRITGAGMAEWADSWVLVRHREPARVAEGSFRLTLDIGSRQWGGAVWDLDVELGVFDPALGEHTGEITWECVPNQDLIVDMGRSGERMARATERVADYVADHPWEYTRSQVAKQAGGTKTTNDAALGRLLADGVLVVENRPRPEGGRTVARDVVGPGSNWVGARP